MSQILFRSILFATDFSPASTIALPYGAAIARQSHGVLYLAFVIAPEAYNLIPQKERDKVVENISVHAEERMTGLRASPVLEGIDHRVLVDHGDIWPRLSAMVKTHDIDLIVIGTHGRRGLDKLLLGSTAEEILRLSMMPVLLVGPESSVGSEGKVQIRRILYATDFSPESKPAMHYAYELAKTWGASLAFLHVAEDVWKEPLSTRMGQAGFFRERLVENNWAVEEEGIVPEYYVEFGPPAERILEVARSLPSDLIVVGLRGTNYPRVAAHLPGPVAYDIVTRARCPVLAIRGQRGGNR
jgi:nucleotide-binding universal stress UspA family protein